MTFRTPAPSPGGGVDATEEAESHEEERMGLIYVNQPSLNSPRVCLCVCTHVHRFLFLVINVIRNGLEAISQCHLEKESKEIIDPEIKFSARENQKLSNKRSKIVHKS